MLEQPANSNSIADTENLPFVMAVRPLCRTTGHSHGSFIFFPPAVSRFVFSRVPNCS
jgi:hypothetical protein